MNTKICFKCQQDLPLSSFNKNSSKKDGLAHECRECKKLYQRKFYLDNKQDHILKANSRKQELRRKLKELKSTLKCNCGESHPACLQFHHINDDKEIEVSTAVSLGWSWYKIVKEIEKCQVLCANCHFKLHYEENDLTNE